tara:strand:- start:3465 stop:4175 length:711 start_codon:yes stop_codon:yes gene_type:complete
MIFPFILILQVLFFAGCVSGPLIAKKKPPKINKVSHGTPYRVQNKIYYPLVKVGNFTQEGVASWYGLKFHGRLTSNKEIYDMHAMTAAHKTLPFNSKVRVVNIKNNREVIVRINDRGPFVNDRIIDLSFAAARQLAMMESGTVRVRLTVLNPNSAAEKISASFVYSVQIGIYRTKSNARKLAQSTANGRVEASFKKGTQLYRVLVGNYRNYKRALKKLDLIKQQGFLGAFIVSNQN